MKKTILITIIFMVGLISIMGCSNQKPLPEQEQKNQQKLLDPTRCVIAAPIFCENPAVDEEGIFLTINNQNNFDLQNVVVKITNCGNSNYIDVIPSYQRKLVNIKCSLTPNEKFYGDISVEYSQGSKTGYISTLIKPLNNNQQEITSSQNENELNQEIPKNQPRNEEEDNIQLPTVKSFTHLTEFEEIGTTETSHNITQLVLNKPVLFNLKDILVKVEVIDFKSNDPNYEHKVYNKDKTQHWVVNDWAKIKINNDKVDIFPDEEMVKVELTNGEVIFIAAAMVSDDNVLIFIADKLK